MAITINGTGTITGISAGGLPDGSVTAADLASSITFGKILQVVQTVKTDTFSTTNVSETAITGLSASITPTSTSSKILVRAQFSTGVNAANYGGFYYLYYNDGNSASKLTAYAGDAAGSRTRAASAIRVHTTTDSRNIALEYLHSPAKDTSISYQIYTSAEVVNYPVRIGATGNDGDSAAYGRMPSTITLMEVAA